MPKKFLIIIPALALIFLFGSSYALLKETSWGDDYKLKVANLEVTFYKQDSDDLKVINMYPMSDKEGINQAQNLVLAVKNKKAIFTKYNIYLEDLSNDYQLKDFIHFAVNKNNKGFQQVRTLSENNYIDLEASLENEDEENIYEVKVWLDEFADNYINKNFASKVIVEVISEENSFD